MKNIVKNENDLKRLEGSMQAIEYVAYGKDAWGR